MNEIWSWQDIVRARQEGRRQGLREAAGVGEEAEVSPAPLPPAAHSCPLGYRRLRIGERIEPGDLANALTNVDWVASEGFLSLFAGFMPSSNVGSLVLASDGCAYYRCQQDADEYADAEAARQSACRNTPDLPALAGETKPTPPERGTT